MSEQEKQSDGTEQKPVELKEHTHDLFADSALQNAYKSLTPEQREKYRKIGEHMYGDLNFKEGQVMDSIAPPFEEAAVYIGEGIKSGLHPSFLDENEVAVMVQVYGEEWYEKWDYKKEDLDEVF